MQAPSIQNRNCIGYRITQHSIHRPSNFRLIANNMLIREYKYIASSIVFDNINIKFYIVQSESRGIWNVQNNPQLQMSSMQRSYSNNYLNSNSPSNIGNKNVEWMATPGTWLSYIVFLALFWGLLHISQIVTSGWAWTVTNGVHCLVSI